MKNTSMLSALFMQMISKYSNVIIQIIITMILSRLLSPREYGVVAVVTVFLTFFQVLSDLGISTSIVQYKDLTKKDYNSLFFFSLLLGIGLALTFCIISFPLSLIYKNSELILLCCCASPAVLFSTLNMVPNGVILKNKDFKSISIRLVVASICAGVIAILLAFCGAGAFSLVANTVISNFVILIWNWVKTKLSFSNPHFISSLKRIFKFSIFQGGFSIINYFSRNLDNLLVGALMGTVQLGFYDKAYKLMQYPITYLSGVFSSVLQPYLSEYEDKRKVIYVNWLGICRILFIIGCLIASIFFVFSYQIINLMFGVQWLSAAPVLAMLSISLPVQVVNSTSGAIFQSTGHTDYLFYSGLLCTGISIIAILFGVFSMNIIILGLAISIAYCIHFSLTIYYLVWKIFAVKPISFLRWFFVPLFSFVISSIISEILLHYFDVPAIIVLFVLIVAYVLICVIGGQGELITIFKQLKLLKGNNNE